MYENIEFPIFQSELTQLFGKPNKRARNNPWLKFINLEDYRSHLSHVRGLDTGEGFGFWGHELLELELPPVIETLAERDYLGELKTFDGCWNVRLMTSGKTWSVHSWGLAIDFNAAENPFGGDVDFSDDFLACWADNGWECGAIWNTPDGMHFQLCWTSNWFNKPQTRLTPKYVVENDKLIDKSEEGIIY